ncbi:PilZ domain-containing protein [Corallococcus macrosporus]|uniref:PilZ domain-containing protein n=1 Tax=Corallococcus macrosporus TaxID=35 RepID=A0ABS3D3T7_9BACT|nr:PilZ domain-containing protein [Corallococcus macrosporus]MBN8226308.1 PilZ domain-containing protein [Corallococcus macrosporus]
MSEQNENQDTRTGEDRRDSPRVPMRLKVGWDGADGFLERAGDLSLGGVGWVGEALDEGKDVMVRFTLPSASEEAVVKGKVLAPKAGMSGPVVRVRFVDLPVELELAIARHLDEQSKDEPRGAR